MFGNRWAAGTDVRKTAHRHLRGASMAIAQDTWRRELTIRHAQAIVALLGIRLLHVVQLALKLIGKKETVSQEDPIPDFDALHLGTLAK